MSDDDTSSIEYIKDLEATYERNTKPVTITLTAIEVFAIVSTIQIAKVAISELGSMGGCAQEAAKKMHDHLDPNSLLFLHLNEGWDLEKSNSSSGVNFPAEDFPLEEFTSYG
jgi:hypothetical protein